MSTKVQCDNLLQAWVPAQEVACLMKEGVL